MYHRQKRKLVVCVFVLSYVRIKREVVAIIDTEMGGFMIHQNWRTSWWQGKNSFRDLYVKVKMLFAVV
jgi:hypothetical protein